jgi:hypothetical protein
MKSMLPDPNNHVPPVSPGDDWGDAEGFDAQGAASPAALPPRRAASDRSANSSPSSAQQVGLRIDGPSLREDPVDAPLRLQVTEHKLDVIKLDQPVDAPPKVVALLKFQERPQRPKGDALQQGEGRDWGDRHRFSMRWIIGLGLGVAGLVVLSISLLPMINASNASRPGAKETLLVVEETAPPVVIPHLDFLSNKQTPALAILQRYWQAKQVAEVLPLVRDSAKMTGILSQNWRPREVSENPLAKFSPEDSTWETVEMGGKACGILRSELPDSTNLTAYFVCEADELRMDWKATFAFGTSTFEELSSGKGAATEVRGTISRTEFYCTHFPEDDFQSYRFLSPSDEKVVWVYSRRSGPVADSLMSVIGSGEITGDEQPPQKITLHLERGPDGTSGNQWIIREIVQIDWLTP